MLDSGFVKTLNAQPEIQILNGLYKCRYCEKRNEHWTSHERTHIHVWFVTKFLANFEEILLLPNCRVPNEFDILALK